MPKTKPRTKPKKKSAPRPSDVPSDVRAVIEATLKPARIPVEKLNPNPQNMRRHNERSIRSIMESLARFGPHAPLVVRKADNVVMNGNGRLEAMKRLAEKDEVWATPVCILIDEAEVDSQLRAIADNRTGEHSEWDYERLGQFWQDLAKLKSIDFDAILPGWNQSEIEPLLKATWTPPALEPLHVTEPGKDKGGDGEEPPDPQMKAVYVTPKDYKLLEQAAVFVRDSSGKSELTVGQCVVRIVRGYVNKKQGS